MLKGDQDIHPQFLMFPTIRSALPRPWHWNAIVVVVGPKVEIGKRGQPHKCRKVWQYKNKKVLYLNFMWINQGDNTVYLGFQIGFNISTETISALFIHSIWQKLIHWISKKLSLIGRIIVANQVLLTMALYNISCWIIFKECIH